ncbi:MAG: phosphoribosylanthranilate isomerase [Haloferacaceae archaeon]
MRVKVCGVTREADLRAVAAAGADAVGVVTDVTVDTPREVPPERAGELLDAAPPFLSTAAVTMPETPAAAADVAERTGADHLQVHGLSDPDDVAAMRDAVRARLVVAVGAADPATARAVAPAADGLLVDSATESGGGGTGETHDWAATRELAADLDTPVVLAGGLDPENVATAVRTVDPYGVDVASGVERSGGVKDHDAVDTFVREARRAGDARGREVSP